MFVRCRHDGLGRFSARRRLLVRPRRGAAVLPVERDRDDLQSASAGHGRLQVAFQRNCAHCLVGAQLLLSVGYRNARLVVRLQAPIDCHRFRCGNVAAILELDEQLQKEYTIFDAAPQVRHLSYMQHSSLVANGFLCG